MGILSGIFGSGNFVCKHCGKKTSLAVPAHCWSSKNGKHEWVKAD